MKKTKKKIQNIKRMGLLLAGLFAIVLGIVVYGNLRKDNENMTGKKIIRVGYFPNLTHAQAVYGMQTGQFQKLLGDDVIVQAKTFNAGPSEIEALFAEAIDIGYIGPSPAINGYIKSNGEAIRIVSGAALGGASLVVQPELAAEYNRKGAMVFEGKTLSSPQQGNTQDISLRHYLKQHQLTDKTRIIAISNSDQFALFIKKEIDGAWVPEPWASRLVIEANGVRVIDERDLWDNRRFCTSNIIVSAKFLRESPDLVKKWLQAHIEITNYLNTHPAEAKETVNEAIGVLTGYKIPEAVLDAAWLMLEFSADPGKSSVMIFADWAYAEGFLGIQKPDLKNLYDLTILNSLTDSQYQ